MLIHDFREIGNRLYAVRKRLGLTQMEVAERAGLSLRTYADIERGTVNMRVETALQICEALHITPDACGLRGEGPGHGAAAAGGLPQVPGLRCVFGLTERTRCGIVKTGRIRPAKRERTTRTEGFHEDHGPQERDHRQ